MSLTNQCATCGCEIGQTKGADSESQQTICGTCQIARAISAGTPAKPVAVKNKKHAPENPLVIVSLSLALLALLICREPLLASTAGFIGAVAVALGVYGFLFPLLAEPDEPATRSERPDELKAGLGH